MATWDDVRAHLRRGWRIERDEAAAFAIACQVPIGQLELHQAVGLAPTTIGARPWLSIIAELFPEAALTGRGALQYADRLPLGAIVLRGTRYLLRHGLPLDSLTLPELDWHLRVLVQEAVKLRANLRGPNPAGATDAFGNYAE